MSKRDKYAPDYSKLYPGVTITPGVMRVLRQTDRKMQYFELDLKAERRRRNKKKQTVTVVPAREDSLERLTENNARRYLPQGLTVEDAIIERDELERLHEALKSLPSEDHELIYAIFFEGLTERQLSARIGVPQKTLHYRKVKAIQTLKEKIT